MHKLIFTILKSKKFLSYLILAISIIPIKSLGNLRVSKELIINGNEIQTFELREKIKKPVHSETFSIASIQWEKTNDKDEYPGNIYWEKYKGEDTDALKKRIEQKSLLNKKKKYSLNSFNRSIVFSNNRIGPDISWIVPPGLAWNNKYKFDFSARGHNTQIPEPPNRKFFGWNDGDAVGLVSYQFLHNKKTSFGLNMGVRSIYQGDQALGGNSNIGEGLSSGFRWDYEISETSGIAIGAEQLIHFDKLTDTGRNIYITASKAWWSQEYAGHGLFPLYVATAGFGTGRMAVGSVKGFCSDILGGSGTETQQRRDLCWSPVFSIARVSDEKFSTFFEYNSRFFLFGTSYAPIQNIPIRGTFALIISDHIDNYKIHNPSEMNWTFNISFGF